MTVKKIIEGRAMIIMLLLYMSIWDVLRVVHIGVVIGLCKNEMLRKSRAQRFGFLQRRRVIG